MIDILISFIFSSFSSVYLEEAGWACPFDDKRFQLAERMHTLAYGHHGVSTNVEQDAPADGAEGRHRGLTDAYARKRRIPLRKNKYAPAGKDPQHCFSEARRALNATLVGAKSVTNAASVATSLSSTAPERVALRDPKRFLNICWTTLNKSAVILLMPSRSELTIFITQ